ncbi:MAG: tetratricopeptide repeat protein [Thiomicrospira sp.]|uniref:YfgM family protein n=1 Tax=Thiomicrospira sp. TaxID=935 RepID=UPI0019F48666|nr:tetratricopeptide repeat protein [Thiomicrospira sp.]MBE0492901.1 tetratricopeptide repeat protein [Thiomicrospira sp.]
MSRYDTEQEQMDAIKAWWAKYGTLILSGVLIVAIAFAGWRYWQSYSYTQSANASATFEVLELSHQNAMFGEVSREARRLMQDQPNSPYAGAAAMMLAQFHWDKAESEEALEALQWVVDAKQPSDMKAAAQLRMARIHIELSQLDEAQNILDGFAAQTWVGAQQANVDYVSALLAQAQQNFAQAQAAFKRVVDNEEAQADLRNIARLQMDDLAQ